MRLMSSVLVMNALMGEKTVRPFKIILSLQATCKNRQVMG